MEKHIPKRMCIGCRQMKPKSSLVRMVKDKNTNKIIFDKMQNIQARGIYLCKNPECIDMAKKKKAIERNFKMQIDDTVYERAKDTWIKY